MNELLNINHPEENTNIMTTKQLSEILGVDERTVRGTAQRLGISESTFRNPKGGRPSKVFNEKQATLIKQEIQKHHNLQKRQIDGVTTEQEENETVMKAMQILVQRKVKLENELKEAQTKLIEQQPKVEYYDTFIDRGNAICFRNVAAELGVSLKLMINTLIANDYIYKDIQKVIRPYNLAVRQGYFVVKDWVNGEKSGEQCLVTPKGKQKIKEIMRIFND